MPITSHRQKQSAMTERSMTQPYDEPLPFAEWSSLQTCSCCGVGLPLALLDRPLRKTRFCSEHCRKRFERRRLLDEARGRARG